VNCLETAIAFFHWQLLNLVYGLKKDFHKHFMVNVHIPSLEDPALFIYILIHGVEVPGSIPGSGKYFYVCFCVLMLCFYSFLFQTHYLSQNFVMLFCNDNSFSMQYK